MTSNVSLKDSRPKETQSWCRKRASSMKLTISTQKSMFRRITSVKSETCCKNKLTKLEMLVNTWGIKKLTWLRTIMRKSKNLNIEKYNLRSKKSVFRTLCTKSKMEDTKNCVEMRVPDGSPMTSWKRVTSSETSINYPNRNLVIHMAQIT